MDRSQSPSFARGKRVHLVGVAGSGMRSAAELLLQRGVRVSGSDRAADELAPLVALGLRLAPDVAPVDLTGYSAVVHSPAIPAAHPALVAATRFGVPALSYPQLLGRLLQSGRGIAVAGTHGKSTVTTMAAEILNGAGLDPTVICGATPIGRHTGGRHGAGDIVLAEACEYRESFLCLRPKLAVILGVELDHVDCFRDKRQVKAAFTRFAAQVAPTGMLLVNADCDAALRVANSARCRVTTFGQSPAADWRGQHFEHDRGRYRFTLSHHGEHFAEIELKTPGRHNALNAIAAAALAYEAGATAAAIATGLSNFAGLHRRLEPRPAPIGIGVGQWIDDYAHHPTAVAATLVAVRQMHPAARLHCIFQPHQESRTRHFLDPFAAALAAADRVAVTDIFRAREPSGYAGGHTASALAAGVTQRGAAARHVPGPAALREWLREIGTHDVVVTIGAGDLGKIYDEPGAWFREDRAAG